MTGREWQPGDVAMARLDANTEIRVMWTRDGWRGVKGSFYDLHLSARPLVVIDPEDEAQVEAIVKAFVATGVWKVIPADVENLHAHRREQVAAALREFANPTPPKPEEPTGLGAVVEDAEGKRWMLLPEHIKWNRWACCDEALNDRNYASVNAVRVLSEGVTA